MKLLLSNAYIAWSNAIKYHDYIYSGRATLINQKHFVSSLHNAVELFLKQLLIINNDKDIINKFYKPASNSLKTAFNNATDLNSFFESIPCGEENSFETINFFKLINKKMVELLKNESEENQSEELEELKNSLSMLNNLRNSEMHFFIKNNFLSEANFIQLHNFMIHFYEKLEDKNLLPYWGSPAPYSFYSNLLFQSETLKNFSYHDALKNNPIASKIAEIINNSNSSLSNERIRSTDDIYEIIRTENEINDYGFDLDEIFDICDMFLRLDCISVNKIEEDFEPYYESEIGWINPQTYYFINVNL